MIKLNTRILSYMMNKISNQTITLGSQQKLKLLKTMMKSPNRIKSQQFIKYYQSFLPNLNNEIFLVINELCKQKSNIGFIIKILDKFRYDFENTLKRKTSLNEIITLLSAIDFCGYTELTIYKDCLIGNTNRVQIQNEQISIQNLNYFIYSERFSRYISKQNVKSSRLFYNLIFLMDYNLQKIDIQFYPIIINILASYTKQKTRASVIVYKIQNAFSKEMNSIIKKQKPFNDIFNFNNMNALARTYRAYGVESTQILDIYLQFIQIVIRQNRMFQQVKFRFYCQIYLNFAQTKNQRGIYYKDILFHRIVNKFYYNSMVLQKWSQNESSSIVCLTHLADQFYKHHYKLPFKQKGSFKYLTKNDLGQPPTIHNIIWKIYKNNPKVFNRKQNSKHIIKTIYPSQYIEYQCQQQEFSPLSSQTQMKIRVHQSLLKLNIKFKTQLQQAGRYLDFVTEDNIVLQVDGGIHFKANSFQLNSRTWGRNIHLIYSGYPLILINVFQYNLVREIEDLTQLIEYKLQILKQKDAILVM